MKILVLGKGIMGRYLSDSNGWDNINRASHGIDINQIDTYREYLDPYDIIVNCIAHTDTYDKSIKTHWDVNYKGLSYLADLCDSLGKKLVHISTDHVYSGSVEKASEEDVPVHCGNWYGYTKIIGEAYIMLKCKNYLIIRSTHKKSPFQYDKAYVNQRGNFDYVNVIGDIISKLILMDANGIFNVGTNEKNMYELAKSTNPGVEETTILYHPTTPTDVTMNLEKLNIFLGLDKSPTRK